MFDMGKWLIRLIETRGAYMALREYVEDNRALTVHKQNIYAITFNKGDEPSIISEGDSVEEFRKMTQDALYDAIEHYTSLMVVTAATYTENMFSEFLYETFVAQPASMHEYIVDEKAKERGYVKLTEILAEPDKNALIVRLSRRASQIASNGSAKEVMKRIVKLSGGPFCASIATDVQEIMDKRNQIVHEGRRFRIDEINVDTTYDILELLLIELGLACRRKGIPYEDPASIIGPAPEFEHTS